MRFLWQVGGGGRNNGELSLRCKPDKGASYFGYSLEVSRGAAAATTVLASLGEW